MSGNIDALTHRKPMCPCVQKQTLLLQSTSANVHKQGNFGHANLGSKNESDKCALIFFCLMGLELKKQMSKQDFSITILSGSHI